MNTTATAARTTPVEGGHWYTADGAPQHTVIGKTTGQPRLTTLADARKLNLLPSVTTILKVLHKQGLVDWLIEQAVLATVTTPRRPEETVDEYVHRVLHIERIQDQEAQVARDLGTDCHEGMAALFRGERIEDDLRPYIEPAWLAARKLGTFIKHTVEQVVVGEGYAGTLDYAGEDPFSGITIVDWKTAKKIPTKGSWPEHRLQLAAYAKAIARRRTVPVKTVNIYISTVDCGQFVVCENPPWEEDYECGFAPLLKYWQWANRYQPDQVNAK